MFADPVCTRIKGNMAAQRTIGEPGEKEEGKDAGMRWSGIQVAFYEASQYLC